MARSLLATFPDLGLHVDEVYWMGNEDEGYRVSVRWTALGTHRGHGRCTASRPGAECTCGGSSSCTSEHGRIVEDWMLFNEFDVLAQILKDDPARPLIS